VAVSSPNPALSSKRSPPFQNTQEVLDEQSFGHGSETKNACAGEGQQQFADLFSGIKRLKVCFERAHLSSWWRHA
jgi:hypothetical protein